VHQEEEVGVHREERPSKHDSEELGVLSVGAAECHGVRLGNELK
jgi:hypothetical protein